MSTPRAVPFALLRPLARAIRWSPLAISAPLAVGVVGVTAFSRRSGAGDLVLALRAAAALLCIGAAFGLDDPAASTTAATPTSLLRRRLLRLALLALAAAIPWMALVWLVDTRRGHEAPLILLSLEAICVLIWTLALAAAVARVTQLPTPGSATASLVLVLLAGSALVPAAWSPWLTSGDRARWVQWHRWWVAALLIALGVFFWMSRDPARTAGGRLRRAVRARRAARGPAAGHEPAALDRR